MGLLDILSGAQAISARAKLARQAEAEQFKQRQEQLQGLLGAAPGGTGLYGQLDPREQLAYNMALVPGQESVWGPSVTAQNTAGMNYQKSMALKIQEGLNQKYGKNRYQDVDVRPDGTMTGIDTWAAPPRQVNIPAGAFDPNAQMPETPPPAAFDPNAQRPQSSIGSPIPFSGQGQTSMSPAPQVAQTGTPTQTTQANSFRPVPELGIPSTIPPAPPTPGFRPVPDYNPTPYYQELSKKTVEYQESYTKNAQSANELANTMYQVSGLLEGYPTGAFGPAILGAQKFISSLTGLDFEGMGEADAARSLSNKLATDYRSTADGGGMPGHMSDRDLDFLKQMVPGLMMTPEGRKYLKELAENMRINRAMLERKAWEYNPDLPQFRNISFQAYMNKIREGEGFVGGTWDENKARIEEIINKGKNKKDSGAKKSYQDFMGK